MADKSPRQHLSKKQGKSLAEKRGDKRPKAGGPSATSVVPPTQKR